MASGQFPVFSNVKMWDEAATANAIVSRDALGDIYGVTLRGSGGVVIGGRLDIKGVAKAVDYTAAATEVFIEVDATSGAKTITFPAVASVGDRIYVVIKVDASANAVTVDGNAAETINGAATDSLASQWSVGRYKANAGATAWLKW